MSSSPEIRYTCVILYSAGVPRENVYLICICNPDSLYYYLYNKWPTRGLYRQNCWTLSCVIIRPFHHIDSTAYTITPIVSLRGSVWFNKALSNTNAIWPYILLMPSAVGGNHILVSQE